MADKEISKFDKAVEGLSTQLEMAQALIMNLQDLHGSEKAIEIINSMIVSLDSEKAALLHKLVTIMQSEENVGAGSTKH